MKNPTIQKFFSVIAIASIITFSGISALQAAMPGTPICAKAFKKFKDTKTGKYAGIVIKNNCQVMYDKKWLLGKGVKNAKVCAPAWNAMAKKNVLGAFEATVTHNCPFIYEFKWRKL